MKFNLLPPHCCFHSAIIRKGRDKALPFYFTESSTESVKLFKVELVLVASKQSQLNLLLQTLTSSFQRELVRLMVVSNPTTDILCRLSLGGQLNKNSLGSGWAIGCSEIQNFLVGNWFEVMVHHLVSKNQKKKSLIPTVYNTWVKDFRKWAKNFKISYFWPKLAVWAKNSLF